MSARGEIARSMAEAAADVLRSLDSRERQLAQWPFPSDDERRLWYYTPTDHGGVALGDLDPAQQRLVMKLVATGLSRGGYVTVSTIIGLENVLDIVEGWTAGWARPRGRDPGRYYLRIFGDPADDATWGWRFGGHHLSINHTVVNGEVGSTTPCFLGADPASSPLLGGTSLRPLAAAEDLARDLVLSLDGNQALEAVVSEVAPVDIVGANRSRLSDGDLPLPLSDVWRGRFDGPLGRAVEDYQTNAERVAGLTAAHLDAVRLSVRAKGIPASHLSADQQGALRRLLDVYIGRVPDAIAEVEAQKYQGERVSELAFAWAGSLEPGSGHYYRVQGPRLLIEYDNTQRGANHAHTVWRDPEGDFGHDVLRSHHLALHQGPDGAHEGT